MSKDVYTKRLAELLGVTQKNMNAAIAVVDAEFEALEKAEFARATAPIEEGETTSDGFDDTAKLYEPTDGEGLHTLTTEELDSMQHAADEDEHTEN